MQPGKGLSQVQQADLDAFKKMYGIDVEIERNTDMNIQIFGTKKCNDTKKAERFSRSGA